MIQLTGAGKRFGAKILFEDLNWLISPKERVGIVGANGTGKSTLLKVLAGIETLDYGSHQRHERHPRGLSAAGWHQSDRPHRLRRMPVGVRRDPRASSGSSRSWRAACRSSTTPRPNTSPVADRYHHIQSEFSARDGYNIESRVGTVLSGLGFRARRLGTPRRRIFRRLADAHRARQAAARRAQPPAARRTYKPSRSGSAQLAGNVSGKLSERLRADFARPLFSRCHRFAHCRDLEQARHFYTGSYSKFEQQKTDRRVQLEAAYNNQRERIEQLEAFINRFRYQATKAKQVQSRIKELEKIERIEIPPDEKTIHFRFPQPKPSGRVVAEFRDVSKSYGAKHVFSRRLVHNRARRPRGAGGSQRRGQIDSDQATFGRRTGDVRRILRARP